MYGNDCANATLPWRTMRNSVEESPTSRPTTLARRNHLATLKNRMDSSVKRVVMRQQESGKVADAGRQKSIVHLEREKNKRPPLNGAVVFITLDQGFFITRLSGSRIEK